MSPATSSQDQQLRPDLIVRSKATPTPHPEGEEGLGINAIRFLTIDSIEKAKSGHPGTPMGLAPLAYLLWTEIMNFDPADPSWPNRDRFILSGGHACMLQYASLHLAGYDLKIDDLKQFRQWDSRTPGHPEMDRTPGIEINTGPLGQGVANGVGMAMTERMLAARFNTDDHTIVDHHTYVTCGEGDIMEGITAEAASLAGRLGLNKLILFYDDNEITLEGAAPIELREDVAGWYAAFNWHVIEIANVNDLESLRAAIAEAKSQTEKPTLIIVRSHIGFGSPVQDSAEAHGKALGEDNAEATRKKLDWPYGPFEIPEDIYNHWHTKVAKRVASHGEWKKAFKAYQTAHPEKASDFLRVMNGELPDGWQNANLPDFKVGDSLATRKSGGASLNAYAANVPELIGGSADVAPSTDTNLNDKGDINAGEWDGCNIHFGVREHAMGAICNGMAAHGGLRPFCATFFPFSDYMREPIRLAALMKLPVVFVFTHDSIGLGEDGPTHQPIEHLASFRAMPDTRVIRPADANESAQAWAQAIAHTGPTLLVLSRQGLRILDPKLVDVSKGATVVAPGDDAAILATGSEVQLALDARDLLAASGVNARVVSMPCCEIFREQSKAYQNEVLPKGMPTLAVEAAAPTGWYEFADDVMGLRRFGASAPGEIVMRELGYTPENVAARVNALL
ncbi:MAG: transketolase [Phycisphaerales bacterium]|nr:transketolase [Phycisphaerales bacterium]